MSSNTALKNEEPRDIEVPDESNEADFLEDGNPEVALVTVILSCRAVVILILLRRFI